MPGCLSEACITPQDKKAKKAKTRVRNNENKSTELQLRTKELGRATTTVALGSVVVVVVNPPLKNGAYSLLLQSPSVAHKVVPTH